jgi:hypothetical protein
MDLTQYGLRAIRPEVIDSSMLKDFVDCPSLFYLRHVLGLRRKVRDPEREAPLDWGTLWHKMQELFGITGDVIESLRYLEDHWPDSIVMETDKHGRSKERIARIFFDYVEQYGKQDQEDFELLRPEQFFDVYDEEAGLRWCGRIDRVERRRRTKRIQIRDYKTTSRMGSYYFEQFDFSFQLPGYVWGSSHLLTEPVTEVMLDVLYTLKGSHQFFRRTFRYTPERLSEWRNNVLIYMNQLHTMLDNHLHEPEKWGKNWNHCTQWGLCSFADVHFLPATGDTRLRVLSNDYIEDRWDPRREEETV